MNAWRRGRRGQRQTQLLSGDLALVAEGPDWSCHIRVPSRGGGRLRRRIESAHPCSTAERQARRQHPQGGSISGASLLESSTAAAAMAESAAVRASSFWLRDRIAEGSCPRGATRVARRARVRNATTDDRRLSAVRLNDRRRNRHRRHFDEQRERARRRPAVAGRAEPGLNRPRRRSGPGGPLAADQLIRSSFAAFSFDANSPRKERKR